MKTSTARSTGRPRRFRSRFGYDHAWWGEPAHAAVPAGRASYWSATRTPMACLVFVLPMLAAYEIGVALVGGTSADAMRTGADAWMRQAMAALGLRDRWLSPLCLVGAMLAWQAFHGESWKLRLSDLLGMAMESLVLAIALIGVSRLVDLGFDRLDVQTVLQAGPSSSRQSVSAVIGFLGAGVYEEALFRLALIPAIYGSARLIHTPEVLAGTVAVTGSALLFSLAHHAGAPGESFTWFAFIFRWLAGIFFAWVFLVRGFGVAVGTHAAYDVLVGWVGLHF